MYQGTLQEDVNTALSLKIFSPMKSAYSTFSCGIPFVLPSFVKKDLESEIQFLILRP